MEKYILTFITLLITSLSFAQLTVRDNAYIFIDGDGFSSELSDGAYITIITLDNNNSLNKKIIIQNN